MNSQWILGSVQFTNAFFLSNSSVQCASKCRTNTITMMYGFRRCEKCSACVCFWSKNHSIPLLISNTTEYQFWNWPRSASCGIHGNCHVLWVRRVCIHARRTRKPKAFRFKSSKNSCRQLYYLINVHLNVWLSFGTLLVTTRIAFMLYSFICFVPKCEGNECGCPYAVLIAIHRFQLSLYLSLPLSPSIYLSLSLRLSSLARI